MRMAYDFNSLTKQADEANNRDKFYTDFEDVDPNKLHQISELTNWMRAKAKGSDVREIIAQLFERTWLENIKEGNANMEVSLARGSYPNLKSRLDNVDNKQQKTTEQLAQKANKDDVTSVITPKGTLAYASLPTSGNQIGWYYYCPDGDGAHGAGNYVWNGESWFFGGTGDDGYTKLKNELNDKLGIDTVLLKSLRADYNEDVPMDDLASDFVYTLGDFSQVPRGTTKINLDIYSGGGHGEIFLYRPDATYQRLLVYRKRYNFVAGMNKVEIALTDKDFGSADYLKIAIFAETAGAFKTQSGFLYKYTNADPFTFYMDYNKIDTQVGGYVDAPTFWSGNVTTNKTYPCIDVYFTRPVEKRKKSVITVSQDGTKDFTTIMEAVRNAGDCDNNPVTILIYEGVYDEVVYLRNKHNISLKGVNRDKCIIKNTTGQYYATPVMVNGDFTIENLTLRMEENGFYPEYTDNTFTTYPGYALHIDGNSKDISKETIGRIRNCTCYSEAFPAVGMGVNQNQTVIFENCEFVRNCTKDYFKRDNWKGAFVGHSSNYPTAPNQNLILKDCIFKSNYGYAGNVRGELGDSSAFTLTAINNTFYSDENGKDCFDYTVGQSHLHPMSNGNTATNLNND